MCYNYRVKHNHEGYGKMKHKITVLVSILVIVGVLAASFLSYEHYRNYRDIQAGRARVSAYVQKKSADLAAQKRDEKINGLKAQCAKDHAAFVALPAAQKAKSVGLDCDPALELVQ
jgi:hypothetical protein